MGSVVEHWIFDPGGPGLIPTKVTGIFSALFAMLCSLLRLSCRKRGFTYVGIPVSGITSFGIHGLH